MVQLLCKTGWKFLKKLNMNYYVTQTLHFWVNTKKNWKQTHLDTHVHSSFTHHSQDVEATQVSTGQWMDKQNVICIYERV